ncbi:MAG: type II toxin-antitoxin system RelE/ParE family toxin [Clostridiales Family XIII bacterium]|nr:type II toxin-antitoxin system RelE/ParE family toxin [Clostridiales Family XIII bacterium]
MTYRLIFTETAQKQLKKIDKYQERIIVGWLQKNISCAENPKAHGKGLTGNLAGYWRYRIGDYRIVCKIHDAVCEVIVIQVGHRSKIYS